ncbi:hypothetical protein GOODEAATRI_010794 [Goodea atripinnis]|uniref:Uncharacterized protein n=1 Tax=Goodea atripinnis TaxID=208336 RepID=A0ABV0MGS5_9TELE
MLFEIEQKVSYLSELSVHSESLLLEGRAETKEEAEQLTLKLRSLKDSLLELQQMLQDKQVDIQALSKQLKEITRQVNQCRDLLGGGTDRLYGGEERALMEDTLEGLQERMGLLHSALEQHCESMRGTLQEHSSFQDFTRSIYVYRPGVCFKDAYEELVLMVGSRRSSLNHSLSLKTQYEAALRDLTDLIDTAQDKMAADQKMTVASVIEVQMLLDKHKGLECHLILTQTFYGKVSSLVAQRESQGLEETMTLAHNVLKQAHRRGVELEGILEEFSKEVDAKSSLRSSVLSTGNQLLRLKRVDTAGLRTAMGQVDTQWAELLTHIPVVQEKLHQV